MKRLTQEELDSILADHKLWLESERTKGKQADLRETYLRGFKMDGADMREADMRESELCGTNLVGASMYKAKMDGADMREAKLYGAKMDGANLCGADLREADMREAKLYGAKMDGANLCGADLREANLREANLREADLRGANIDFSCLPLWCGSLSAHFDDRQLRQIAYHLVRAGLQSKNASPETKAELAKLIDFANGFHRVEECGMIEKPEV